MPQDCFLFQLTPFLMPKGPKPPFFGETNCPPSHLYIKELAHVLCCVVLCFLSVIYIYIYIYIEIKDRKFYWDSKILQAWLYSIHSGPRKIKHRSVLNKTEVTSKKKMQQWKDTLEQSILKLFVLPWGAAVLLIC